MASRQLHYFPQAHPYVPRSVETSEDQQASDEAKPFKLADPITLIWFDCMCDFRGDGTRVQ